MAFFRSLIKAILNMALLAVIVGTAYYTYTKLRPIVPCAEPIHFKIGTFDNRFGISRENFIATIEKATTIWEKPIGRDLFVYDENGPLEINLVYDTRQQTTQKNQVLESSANSTKRSASEIQAQYQALKNSYEQEKAVYEAGVIAFNADQRKYQQEVEYYNKRGGAPQAEYQRLNAEKESLAVRQAALDAKRVTLNSEVLQINTMIDKYNLLVQHVNEVVTDINSTAGKEFNEGLYVQNGGETHIDIYEYSTKLKLLRVLAHELGHALGLDHNADPKSIMYALNQSKTEVLSAADLASLKARCRIKE